MSTAEKTTARVRPAPHRVIGRVSETLRAASRQVREQVAADREQIAAEAQEVLREAEASGKLRSIRILFQPSEQEVLDAMDTFAREHGLNSRAQVVRVALQKLLKIDVAVPKWGWRKGRARKSPT
jgi:vacuolar-type H+-ATPase subunit H